MWPAECGECLAVPCRPIYRAGDHCRVDGVSRDGGSRMFSLKLAVKRWLHECLSLPGTAPKERDRVDWTLEAKP